MVVLVFSSKHAASIAARAQGPTLAGEVEAKAVEVRTRTSGGNLRPQTRADNDSGDAGLTRGASAADGQGATGPQSYAQWAQFTLGAPGEEFGPCFEDKASPAKYTWTPARRG